MEVYWKKKGTFKQAGKDQADILICPWDTQRIVPPEAQKFLMEEEKFI